MRATGSNDPRLVPIDECYLIIPVPSTSTAVASTCKITAVVLPEITDTKSVHYNDEPVIGRSIPIKTFSYGDNRTITVKWHFVTVQSGDSQNNLGALRAIQSACYVRDGVADVTFLPPPICKLKCGDILSTAELCVVLRQYTISAPTDVAWDENTGTLMPYKFDVDMVFDVVYSSSTLPGQSMIFMDAPVPCPAA